MTIEEELKNHTPAEALKALRDINGMSLKDVETATGIDRTAVSAHEHCRHAIGMKSAETYAVAFNVPRSVFGWPTPEEKERGV